MAATIPVTIVGTMPARARLTYWPLAVMLPGIDADKAILTSITTAPIVQERDAASKRWTNRLR